LALEESASIVSIAVGARLALGGLQLVASGDGAFGGERPTQTLEDAQRGRL
jgi:hypothetical protein